MNVAFCDIPDLSFFHGLMYNRLRDQEYTGLIKFDNTVGMILCWRRVTDGLTGSILLPCYLFANGRIL